MIPTLRRIPIAGEVIEPKLETACIGELSRVLDVHEGSNRLTIIPIVPRRSSGRIYWVGPRIVELSKVICELDQRMLVILPDGVTARADATANDEDLDKKYLRCRQKISNPRRDREVRNAIIDQLIESSECSKLLLDRRVRSEKIRKLAQKLYDGKRSIKRTVRMLNDLLNQYCDEPANEGAWQQR